MQGLQDSCLQERGERMSENLARHACAWTEVCGIRLYLAEFDPIAFKCPKVCTKTAYQVFRSMVYMQCN